VAKTYFLRWQPANAELPSAEAPAAVLTAAATAGPTAAPVAESNCQWLLLDGGQPGALQSGSLSTAASQISGRCILVLPADWLTYAVADVPVRGAQALRRAVPYALEDQFAIDVDRLQFAIGSKDGANGVPVLVLDKKRLASVLDELQSVGIKPLQCVSEADLLPPDTVLVEADQAIFRCSDGRRGGADLDMLPLLFGDDSWPSQLVLTPASREAVARLRPGSEAMITEAVLPFLANQQAITGAINLLQGDFAPQAELAKHAMRWRLPIAFAAALAVVLFGMKYADLRDLRQQGDNLYAQIKQEYESALPNARLTANPKPIIERALRTDAGSGSSSGGVALTLMAELGKALNAQASAGRPSNVPAAKSAANVAPGAELTSLGYRKNGLDVRLLVDNLPALAPVEKELQEAGLQTSIQSTTTRNDKTEVRMRIADGSEVAER